MATKEQVEQVAETKKNIKNVWLEARNQASPQSPTERIQTTAIPRPYHSKFRSQTRTESAAKPQQIPQPNHSKFPRANSAAKQQQIPQYLIGI